MTSQKKNNPYRDNSFQTSELKTILHSKRANIYHLEHCRVMKKKDGRVLYLTEAAKKTCITTSPLPTTVILLGTGTSITQASGRHPLQSR